MGVFLDDTAELKGESFQTYYRSKFNQPLLWSQIIIYAMTPKWGLMTSSTANCSWENYCMQVNICTSKVWFWSKSIKKSKFSLKLLPVARKFWTLRYHITRSLMHMYLIKRKRISDFSPTILLLQKILLCLCSTVKMLYLLCELTVSASCWDWAVLSVISPA